MPTVSVAAVCALLSGILATTVESVGDYHACAKLAGVPPPPLHAVNRGTLITLMSVLGDIATLNSALLSVITCDMQFHIFTVTCIFF